MMNAVHDLAVMVAQDEGLFRDEGLDVEVIDTGGTGRVNPVGAALQERIFDRSLEAMYNEGGLDQYRMCEWGVMKRTVESLQSDQRPARIVALGSAMTRQAIITSPTSGIVEPEQFKDTPVAVSPYNGSHFTTLKMLEGFVAKDRIKITDSGTMRQRLEAVANGDAVAGNFNEPWISVAQKNGMRIIMESNSTRSEAAGDELDGPTLAAMFRAEARASEMINTHPEKYVHYFVAETGGLLEASEVQTWRLLYGPPAPYTRERFDYTYQWMLGYPDLVTPGATYEASVDNRAWEV
jgi:ABC-type nitrate/sulfonate/bicarbonate transport system substrate-binding protein